MPRFSVLVDVCCIKHAAHQLKHEIYAIASLDILVGIRTLYGRNSFKCGISEGRLASVPIGGATIPIRTPSSSLSTALIRSECQLQRGN